MNQKIALLIDTISIQRYVFAGNRLKENIGASRIVQEIYEDTLSESVAGVLGHTVDFTNWRKEPEKIFINDPAVDFEVGYIGGGNALLLFKEEEQAKEVLESWTRRLLVEAPGIRTAVALSPFDLYNFRVELDRLFCQLTKNKNEFSPQTVLPKHGITMDCPLSGLSADVYHHEPDFNRYISAVVKAKLDKAMEENLSPAIKAFLEPHYTFTNEINNLGQEKGESHIAVIHIDGNSLGEAFKSCQSLAEIRQLSVDVANIMETALKEMITYITSKIEYFEKPENGFQLRKKDGRIILPFRPLLLGGDDFTFVADGRLGIPLAKVFLCSLTGKKIKDKTRKLSACAGISITKTKYPFYHSYQLAEELCKNAKKEARKNHGTSWLDFHLSYGGFSGSLESIREKHYCLKDSRLNFGPYLVAPDNKENGKNINFLINGIKEFDNEMRWPRSKVKEMRMALTLGKESATQFLSDMKSKNRQPLPLPNGTYEINGFENGTTPYFDQIELTGFYPEFLRE